MAIMETLAIVQRIRPSLRFGNDLLALFFEKATNVVAIETRLIRLKKIIANVVFINYLQLSQ